MAGLRPGRVVGKGKGKGKGKAKAEESEEEESEVAELRRMVRWLSQEMEALRRVVKDGFKKNRRELRGYRDLMDKDWEEHGSEVSEGGSENMVEMLEETRGLRRERRRLRRQELWKRWDKVKATGTESEEESDLGGDTGTESEQEVEVGNGEVGEKEEDEEEEEEEEQEEEEEEEEEEEGEEQ